MNKPLPTYKELHHSPEEAFKNDQFLTLVNQPPHSSWVKEFPAEMRIKGGGHYLPIDKIEFMLDCIFQKWRVQVLEVSTLFNSVAVTVRLHYLNPATGEWTFHDGVGASPVQTDKGESAANLAAIKTRAVQVALPIAKSSAIKDAAEHIGKLFGRDLNRKDIAFFVPVYDKEEAGYTPAPVNGRAAANGTHTVVNTIPEPASASGVPAPVSGVPAPVSGVPAPVSAVPAFDFANL